MDSTIKKVMYCIVVMVLLGGLGLSAAQTPPPLPRDFRIGTSRTGGFVHTIAAAAANVIAKHTTMTPKVIATSGAATWLPMLERGEIDAGSGTVLEAQEGYYGRAIYKEPTKGKGYNILTLSLAPGSTLGVFVRANSDIKKISELKGKKYPRLPGHLSQNLAFTGLLANGGLTYKDVIEVPRASLYDTVAEDIIEGKIDAAVLPLNSAKAVEINTVVGIRYLSCDPSPEAVRRTTEIYPSYVERITEGVGIKEPTNLLSHPNIITARGDLPDNVTYEIIKAIWQHYEELGTIHEDLKKWTPKTMVSTASPIPYHPGAIKWYKEQGVWTNELEQQQKRLMKK